MSVDLCRRRLEKAERTFKEGEQLLDAGSYNGAINRFYRQEELNKTTSNRGKV